MERTSVSDGSKPLLWKKLGLFSQTQTRSARSKLSSVMRRRLSGMKPKLYNEQGCTLRDHGLKFELNWKRKEPLRLQRVSYFLSGLPKREQGTGTHGSQPGCDDELLTGFNTRKEQGTEPVTGCHNRSHGQYANLGNGAVNRLGEGGRSDSFSQAATQPPQESCRCFEANTGCCPQVLTVHTGITWA